MKNPPKGMTLPMVLHAYGAVLLLLLADVAFLDNDLTTSYRLPRLQYSVTIHTEGGTMQQPSSFMTLRWLKEASILASRI